MTGRKKNQIFGKNGIVPPSPAENNYTVTELECLAVVRVIDHFAIHLLRRDFTLVMDHHALAALHSSEKLNERLGGHCHSSSTHSK